MRSTRDIDETARASVRDARRGLGVFLVLVVAGSAPLLYLVVRSGRPVEQLPLYVLPLMWMPAIASILIRLVSGEGFHDLSFRLRDRRILLLVGLAVAFPVLVGTIAYGAAWWFGLVSFSAPAGSGSPVIAFLERLLFAGTIGAIVGIVSAAGEEIGWRGYMIPRLVQSKVPAPFLVGGVLWGLWHVPAIVTGQYAAGSNPVRAAGLFVLLAIVLTILWSKWTLTTGSIWPAIVGHAAWNAVIQGPFDAFSSGPLSTTLVGESGVLVVATTGVLVAILVSGRVPNGVDASPPFTSRPE